MLITGIEVKHLLRKMFKKKRQRGRPRKRKPGKRLSDFHIHFERLESEEKEKRK